MIDINELITQLKSFYFLREEIRFTHPAYIKFHNDLTNIIYMNHFEGTTEWQIISQNLVYKSTQHMIRSEADIILVQLEILKRHLLRKEHDVCWDYIHPAIIAVSKSKLIDGYYSDAVESALKEVNSRVKKLYKKIRNEERDGQDLMRKAFSAGNPALIFEGLDNESGRNVQEGYSNIFAGAIQAIRNPKAHENTNISRDEAVKRLVFAGLLMDKIDEAIKYTGITE